MKKNKALTTSIIATSLATIGFVSYKIIKDKYPDKIDNFNEYIKNNILNKNSDLEEKSLNISVSEYNKKNNIENKNNIIDNSKKVLDNNNSDNSKTFLIQNNIENIDNSNNNISDNIKNDNIENNISDNIKNDDIENNIIDTILNNIVENNIDTIQTNIMENMEEYETKENEQNSLDKIIENDTILLPDNYIEDEIRYQLCLRNKEPITKSILKKLERIDFFEINDIDIEIYCDFLSEYTNIKSIVIDSLNPLKAEGKAEYSTPYNSLKDISPLNKLTSLEELCFNWGIENIDFSVLTDLENLKKLELKFGMLKDITFIENFKNLEHLEIMISNSVKDLSSLTKLNKLNKLYLYTNKKFDTEILKEIKSLKYIYINGESITL